MNRDIIETTGDLVYETSEYTRVLAGLEVVDGGVFGAEVRRIEEVEDLSAAAVESGVSFSREVFASLYGFDQRLPEERRVGWAARVLEACEELPEWRSMQRFAKGSSWECALTTARILEGIHEQLVEQLRQLQVKSQEELEEQLQQMAESGTSQETLDELRQEQEAALAGNELGTMMIAAAASVAVDDAAEEIEGLRAMVSAFGCGNESSDPQQMKAPSAEMVTSLAKDPYLQRVAELAGRMTTTSRAIKALDQKGRSEVADVEFGDDLQLMTLRARQMPALQFARRYVDRALPQRKLTGERESGPIVIVIDESGSMDGDRITMAKALMLTLARTCVEERRAFGVVRFDTSAYPSEPKSMQEMIGLCQSFLSGGTDTKHGLRKASELAKKLGPEADVVLVTDGCDYWTQQDVTEILGDRRLHAVAIAASFNEEQQAACASYVELRDVDLGNAEAKIGVCLGL